MAHCNSKSCYTSQFCVAVMHCKMQLNDSLCVVNPQLGIAAFACILQQWLVNYDVMHVWRLMCSCSWKL